jgi:hypothetical protein
LNDFGRLQFLKITENINRESDLNKVEDWILVKDWRKIVKPFADRIDSEPDEANRFGFRVFDGHLVE